LKSYWRRSNLPRKISTFDWTEPSHLSETRPEPYSVSMADHVLASLAPHVEDDKLQSRCVPHCFHSARRSWTSETERSLTAPKQSCRKKCRHGDGPQARSPRPKRFGPGSLFAYSNARVWLSTSGLVRELAMFANKPLKQTPSTQGFTRNGGSRRFELRVAVG
jgi:hypothetical protein